MIVVAASAAARMTSRGGFLWGLICALALVAGGIWIGVRWPTERAPAPQSAPQPAAVEPRPVVIERVAPPAPADPERAAIALFHRVSPSVAYITSLTIRTDFFGLNPQTIPRGSGSGFVWDAEGHVVTNYHVIQGARGASVTLADQSRWDAILVGTAPEKDLAVLRIEVPRERLSPIELGSSREVQVGQTTFAIGNPFGLDQTLTTGIVSALGREIVSPAGRVIRDVIQTDAAINPGNSGGPLLDSAGRLIGVNTAIASPSGAYAGIGFAIPVDTVGWVVPELIEKGRIERPTLGVSLLPSQAAPNLRIDGALVLSVAPGSGAERAGLRGTTYDRRGRLLLGDVIVEVAGRPVRTDDDLLLALDRRRAGETVSVTVLRDGERLSLDVELGRPAR